MKGEILHKLPPPLGALQKKGCHVALVTDGRMSGASGQVPPANHVSPGVLADGPLGRVRNGDVIRLDAIADTLAGWVEDGEWQRHESPMLCAAAAARTGHDLGRELVAGMRRNVNTAVEGACTWL